MGSLVIPDSITTIGQSAFDNMSNITDVVIGSNLSNIPNCCFRDCTSLKFIQNLSTNNSLTSIGNYAFSNCCNLEGEISLNNKITLIGNHAFNGCSKITSLILNDSITKIGDYAFKNCLITLNQFIFPASIN